MRISTGARAIVGLAAGYAIGNIPSADIASRAAHGDNGPDLRVVGSQNPGALNAGKELGTGWGAAVMAADVGKGVAAAAIGRRLGGPNLANLAASAAVAGHCFPTGTRTGGKGVSTSIGQVIATFPAYLPLDIAVALGTAALPRWTQRTWAGTATASVVWVTSGLTAWRRRWSTGIDTPAPPGLPIAAAVTSAIIAKRFLDTPLTDGKPNTDDEPSARPDLKQVAT